MSYSHPTGACCINLHINGAKLMLLWEYLHICLALCINSHFWQPLKSMFLSLTLSCPIVLTVYFYLPFFFCMTNLNTLFSSSLFPCSVRCYTAKVVIHKKFVIFVSRSIFLMLFILGWYSLYIIEYSVTFSLYPTKSPSSLYSPLM